MANQNQICRYNKFGFCKFGEFCRKRHISEKCIESSCEISSCNFRHPKICKYFREFRRCKFGEYCYFDHKESGSELLEKRVNDLIIKVEKLEKKLEEKESNQLASHSDFYTLEKKIEKIDKLLEEKNKKIEELEQKIMVVEVKCVEKAKRNQEKASVICKFCPFEAKSASGLKVHMKRKHTFKDIDIYPTNCDICEKTIENNLKMKRHMENHSYINAEYKCLECDFICDEYTEMEVHIRKEHSERFECYLCGLRGESLENLKTHSLTCEVYDCNQCEERTKTLESIKDHILKSHDKYPEYNKLIHLKLSTENLSEIKSKSYYVKDV